MTIPNSNSCF